MAKTRENKTGTPGSRKGGNAPGKPARAPKWDIITHLPESCAVINGKGIILDVNTAFMGMFGIGGSHLSGEALSDFISPADRKGFLSLLARAAAARRRPGTHEFTCERRDGTRFPAVIRVSTLKPGTQATILVQIHDRTGEIETTERMEHLQSLASIGTFASGVVHEFNNVLTGIRGYAQLAARDLANTGLLEKAFSIIEDECRRGSDLCKNMGLYSSRTQLNPEPVSLSEIFETVIALQRKYLAQEGIEVITGIDDLPPLMLDRFQIQQVLLNLLINARHAIIPKGKGVIRLQARGHRDTVSITVADDGIGIDRLNIARIFDPFYTSKGPIGIGRTGAEIKGSGLGLAVSNAIVKKHGGSISVESTPGEGSCFTVKLPRVHAREAARKHVPEKPAPFPWLRHPLNVLVVDDEMSIRELLFRALTARNIAVTLARNAEEAAMLCRAERFDVVVLDYILPEKNGDHLIPVIKEHLPDAKIIMISGWSSSPLKKKKIGKEVSAWIEKPFEIGDLLTTLSELTADQGLKH